MNLASSAESDSREDLEEFELREEFEGEEEFEEDEDCEDDFRFLPEWDFLLLDLLSIYLFNI
jgi:hypothetical protein